MATLVHASGIMPFASRFDTEKWSTPMLHQQFRAAARTHANKLAVIGHNHRLTYGRLEAEALRLASQLRKLGARDGDRVALYMANSAEAAVSIWAVLEAGCVLVPLHAAARKAALQPVIANAEPRWLIAGGELSATYPALLTANACIEKLIVWNGDDNGHLSWRLAAEGAAEPAPPAPVDSGPSALAALIYTSGSTGEPKGVLLSHANMQAALTAVNAYLKLQASDIIYSPLPLASSYGLYQLLLGLAIGATVVLDRSFAFPARSLSLIATERATVFAGVPTMFAWMANAPTLDNFDLSQLRILTSAAAALPQEHARRVRERLPHAQLFIMYGQTECKRISYLEPADLERKPGSVGRGMPFQEHAVVDDFGVPVSVDQVGELVVRGAHVMQGYWSNAEATSQKLRPIANSEGNWLHTDDLFRIDAEGYLYFVGRRDDILKIGGNKVSPSEIEEVLCGEAAKAFLVPKPGGSCTAEAVIRFCTPRLRGYMVPKAVEFLKALPKTESGKVKKRDLIGR
jgi:acyl-CoA synthetase (AMP-forming)/AMP-acid ligase II